MNKIRRVVTLTLVVSLISSLIGVNVGHASARGCDDVQFIFARGSGEQLNDVSYQAWRQEISVQLKDSKLTYSFYELGSAAQRGFRYPAVAVSDSLDGYLNALGAIVSAGAAFDFGSSVTAGMKELQAYVDTTLAHCPKTQFVLGGYSQGAMVLSRSLPQLDADHIIYVTTFGDPKLYLPEGQGGPVSAACRGQNFSSYRIYVPNCQVYEGLLGSYRPYQPTDYADKVGVWCNTKDIMCGAGLSFDDHVAYAAEGLYAQAAAKIAERLAKVFSLELATSVPGSTSMNDVAFLIDSTNSMTPVINRYRAEAKSLARRVLDRGGRIALYEYRDLADPFEPVQHCDFACSYEEFVAKLDNIETAGGGDDRESALSALVYTMSTLKWQVGANKSVVLLTDNGYLTPDRDGTTISDVRDLSRAIDPVNVYIMAEKSLAPGFLKSQYNILAKNTDGAVFDVHSDADLTLSSNTVLGRPVAELASLDYQGLVGDEFTFDARGSYSLNGTELSFDWDLNGDGDFEIIDGAEIVNTHYDAPFSNYIQVRVTDGSGSSSTMAALVTVAATAPAVPAIKQLSAQKLTNDTVEISFETAGATKIAVVVDDALLGLMDAGRGSFRLTDLTASATVTLVPYNNLQKGAARTITVYPSVPTAPNTGTRWPTQLFFGVYLDR